MASEVKPIPDGFESATPMLCVNDAAAALEFYKKAFGAAEVYRLAEPGGRIGHAEIRIGRAVIMLADEYPELGHRGPQGRRDAGRDAETICRILSQDRIARIFIIRHQC